MPRRRTSKTSQEELHAQACGRPVGAPKQGPPHPDPFTLGPSDDLQLSDCFVFRAHLQSDHRSVPRQPFDTKLLRHSSPREGEALPSRSSRVDAHLGLAARGHRPSRHLGSGRSVFEAPIGPRRRRTDRQGRQGDEEGEASREHGLGGYHTVVSAKGIGDISHSRTESD